MTNGIETKSRSKKLLLTLLVTGAAGGLAAFPVFSAFSSTTENPGNSFSAGTVAISDNDAGTALYSLTNQKPGVTSERCIKVTYTGSLDADVKLYASSVAAGGQYVNLAVTSGVGTAGDCADFVADASGSGVYSGTVKGFADTHSGWANGLSDNPLALTKWATNAAVTYKFAVTLQDNNAAQSAATGTHAFTWEARNQ